MAVLESVPTQVSTTLFYNRTADESMQLTFRVTPKDFEGALLDLTGYNTATLQFKPLQAPDVKTPTTEAITISNADATGADITLAPADGDVVINGTWGLPASITIVVGDGTDTLVAARGQMNVTFLP